MKIKLTVLTALLVAITTLSSFGINVVVNGNSLNMDVPPQVINDRTFVPVSSVAVATGAQVQWDATNETATITKDGQELKVSIGAKTATKNKEKISLDAPAQLINGRTMVPLSFIATSLNIPISYEATTDTVYLGDVNLPSLAPQQGTTQSVPNGNQVATVTTTDQNKEGTWIKGNIKSSIYHVPSGRDYGKISPKNIVWFKTEEEAKKAGYRRAMH